METYYLLLDKDSAKVSLGWKVTHLILLAIISVSGFVTALSLGHVRRDFGNRCVLFANLQFTTAGYNETAVLPKMYTPMYKGVLALPFIDAVNSKWGNPGMCNFCQFTPVVSMICALIWFSLFVMCSRGGVGFITDTFSHPWRIVYPSLLFGIACTIVTIVSTIELHNGGNAFCAQFKKIFHTDTCTPEINIYTNFFNRSQHNAYLFLMLTIVCSYICSGSWLAHIFILILRILCIADFQMIAVSVTSKSLPEKVLYMINPKSSKEKLNIVLTKAIHAKTEDKSITAAPSSKYCKLATHSETSADTLDNEYRTHEHSSSNVDGKEIQSSKKQSSPSLNFVDDSPLNEDNNKGISLSAMEKNSNNLGSKETTNETAFQAPRADFSNL